MSATTTSGTSAQLRVAVRYFAAAKAAAGRAEQDFTIDAGTTLEDLLVLVERSLPETGDDRSRQVIARCSVLRNGESGSDGGAVLTDGDVVDLLPPFAGG